MGIRGRPAVTGPPALCVTPISPRPGPARLEHPGGYLSPVYTSATNRSAPADERIETGITKRTFAARLEARSASGPAGAADAAGQTLRLNRPGGRL
jgi:hypothetical protein